MARREIIKTGEEVVSCWLFMPHMSYFFDVKLIPDNFNFAVTPFAARSLGIGGDLDGQCRRGRVRHGAE